MEELRGARRLAILLDYDGTLVPIAATPELAVPDAELLALLAALAARPGTTVHIVSGRPGDTLDEWFAALPLSLWAEHGVHHRPLGATGWETTASAAIDWTSRILPILEEFTASTPGSMLEQKNASFAFHYRLAEHEVGEQRAHELKVLLEAAIVDQPLEVLEGKKVLEVRLRGVTKAIVAHRLLAEAGDPPGILAMGDDRTDEELFAALPPYAVTVAVGSETTAASYRVADFRAARELLRTLLD